MNRLHRIPPCFFYVLGFLALTALHSCGRASAVRVSGDLMVWHTVTLSIKGPESTEDGENNPFLDCRLDVVFSNGGRTYTVPGFFAADGNAAETGAVSGHVWRARFMPDRPGEWRYTAFFHQGPDIAIADDMSEVSPQVYTGSFTVKPSDKTGRNFRAQGLLEYTGERYLQFAGSGEYFIKGGADSPENLLAYADFDGTMDHDGLNRPGEAQGGEFVHTYAPHLGDWREGDPSWREGKGKAIIGMMNYLAGKGMNSVYFLTMNVDGDGKDVWPWTSYDERLRFDVSKLDQWEIVFDHMDRLGLMLHVVTQETENDQLLDNGALGRERKLYYRELIARFAHHPALVWNLGEENTNTTGERKAFADYIRSLDPYRHSIVIHTFPGRYRQVYTPLLGHPSIEGPSLQMGDQAGTHEETIRWLDESSRTGHQWVVCLDEIGPAEVGAMPDKDDPGHDTVRREALWGSLMAGGGGVEWYFGYKFAHNDLNCEDLRSRDLLWDQTRCALDFFQTHLPFTAMLHHDELTASPDDYCFAIPGEIYAVYLPHGGNNYLDLGESAGRTFTVRWYNPRTGGALIAGPVTTITGPGNAALGMPPAEPSQDWAALITAEPRVFSEKDGIVSAEAEQFTSQTNDTIRQWRLMTTGRSSNLKPDSDPNHASGASGGAYLEALPDTRRSDENEHIMGENESDIPGEMAVLAYPVEITTPGRYYVWARMFSTGSFDNGVHVGLDGDWPDSGIGLRVSSESGNWLWTSNQRNDGAPAIYLDIAEPGRRTILFSMRDDGAEFDTWVLTTDREYRPEDTLE